MAYQDWLLSAESAARIADMWRPIGFIDLDRWPHDVPIATLPPFPLIGIGDRGHPIVARLDALVEPPVSADAIVAQILRAPRAAAAAVQLLRSLDGLDSDRALPLESICLGMLQGSAEHRDWIAARPHGDRKAEGQTIVGRDDRVLTIILDRPQAHNAIDVALRDGIHDALMVAALDPDIDTVVLRARGPSFSIGADLAEFGTTSDPATAHLIRARSLPAALLAGIGDRIEAHVQGACIGSGLEMAAFARHIVATPRAWFQLPELAMGIIPGAGGCVSVPRRVGRQRTALMLLSGRRIGAKTALDWGLVDAIVDAPAGDEGGADMV
jgi:enoyl-CoA hydratase